MSKGFYKHMDVDVISFLEEKMKQNTQHYQGDFEIDKKIINRVMESKRKEDKTLLWLSRTNGTQCVKEHDAFVKNTEAYFTWLHFHDHEPESIIAYAVELTDRKDGVIRGNVYDLDYAKHCEQVREKAIEALFYEKTFEDGYVTKVSAYWSSYGHFRPLVDAHGMITDSFAIPEDEMELSAVLHEQRQIRHKMKKSVISFEDKTKQAKGSSALDIHDEQTACRVTFTRTAGIADGRSFDVYLDIQPKNLVHQQVSVSLDVDERIKAYNKAAEEVGEDALSDFVISSAEMVDKLSMQVLKEKYGYLMDPEHGEDVELLLDIMRSNDVDVSEKDGSFFVKDALNKTIRQNIKSSFDDIIMAAEAKKGAHSDVQHREHSGPEL